MPNNGHGRQNLRRLKQIALRIELELSLLFSTFITISRSNPGRGNSLNCKRKKGKQ